MQGFCTAQSRALIFSLYERHGREKFILTDIANQQVQFPAKICTILLFAAAFGRRLIKGLTLRLKLIDSVFLHVYWNLEIS